MCTWQTNTNSNNNKSVQSNLARGPRHGAVAYIRPVGPCGQRRAPKVPLPVDRSPNPTTCLIPGPVRPMMPNGIRIRSVIFPQCRRTHRCTDRQNVHGKVRWLWAAALREQRGLIISMLVILTGIYPHVVIRPRLHTRKQSTRRALLTFFHFSLFGFRG